MTPSPTVTIRASSFNPEQTETSVLCLEVGRDRLQVLVVDRRERDRSVYLEDYTFPSLLTANALTSVLPDLFRDHSVLTAGPWQEVRVGVNSPSFTLVPEPLYRKEYAGSYLTLMRGGVLPADEFTQTHLHGREGFVSVFSMEHQLADWIAEQFPLQPVRFIHQTSTLIQGTADIDHRSQTPDGVYLYFEDEFVTILHWRAHQLQYCNRFGYRNAQDLVYYLLYVLDEQGLPADTTPVVLHGEITPFADVYTELVHFLPVVSFGYPPSSLKRAAEFNELPAHRYLSLYGLGLMSE